MGITYLSRAVLTHYIDKIIQYVGHKFLVSQIYNLLKLCLTCWAFSTQTHAELAKVRQTTKPLYNLEMLCKGTVLLSHTIHKCDQGGELKNEQTYYACSTNSENVGGCGGMKECFLERVQNQNKLFWCK